MTELLPNLTEITTTRDVDTPYGVIPAGTAGTIVSDDDYAAYLAEFEAPWYVVTVPTRSCPTRRSAGSTFRLPATI